MLNKEQREDLLITCIEGGSNYWAQFPKITSITNRKFEGKSYSEAIFILILEGYKINIVDSKTNHVRLGFITYKGIETGEEIMESKSPKHYGQILAEEWDAGTADVWLQYIVFGDIIYG